MSNMRVVSVILPLLLLVQVPKIYVSGSQQYDSCGSYQIRYAGGSDQKSFYINGRLVDRYLFCEALKFYYARRCFTELFVGYHYCGLDIPFDNFPLAAERKLLHKASGEEYTGYNPNEETQRIKDRSAHNILSTKKELAIAFPVMFILCCSLLCPCFHAKKKENPHAVLAKEPSVDPISSMEIPLHVPPSPSKFSLSSKHNRKESVHLNLNQVLRATQNFSPLLKLGEGGFGIVYKAQLPDGQVVAIKRAKKEHFHDIRTEFRSEVQVLAKIEHRNLVKLLGYIDSGNERLIITEYMSNGTLREHLDGLRGKILDFSQRLEIAIDVAHGLTYLHFYSEKQIIHRDVKSSNILLTENMRAKVADFGFARLGDTDSDVTHVSTKVKGTVGYLDPEYMKTNQLTPQSDVFSFGVLLLEILTGRRPVEVKRPADERPADEKVTLRWAFRKYREGNIMEMVDPLMDKALDQQVLDKMFGLAIKCAAPTRADRPDMKSVVEQLWGIRMEYLQSGPRK